MLAGCTMPTLPTLPGQSLGSTQSVMLGDGSGYSPTINVSIPAGTCDAQWFLQGYKGAYALDWNKQVLLHPHGRAQAIRQPPAASADAQAQIIGPQFTAGEPVATTNCHRSSWIAGKTTAHDDAQAAFQRMSGQ
ncbi:hypothetical protein XthCFBP4691_07830 [Xanthomonas theicola]|uniref:Uncharacterized protein n=2 Tax=Xanthomonas theicola TaxID=56464 RepID=A0A2S6ZGP4_9XANT|nr:hypothetical protein XthCFBP4691_07830 [Xanthomonas theicola]